MHHPSDLSSLVGELVRRPSENPPGDEAAVAAFVHEWFTERGIEAHRVEEPEPDRPQVAAVVGDSADADHASGDGGDAGPTLVLNGHTDVVPAGDHDAWRHDPYGAAVEDGRLYGRGAADMKAGLAVGMLATEALGAELAAGDLSGRVVFHAAMGEETADPGTRALLEAGFDGDYGVVLEPTALRTATRAKGLAVYELVVAGEPHHASRPDQGRNAIDAARPLLDAIDAYDAEVRTREDTHVGPGYATVTEFEAGVGTNLAVLPEAARLVLDRRVLPEEDLTDVDEEVAAMVAGVESSAGIEVSWERIQEYASASIPDDAPLARLFRAHSAERAGVPDEPWGIEAATDVRNLVNDAGMEAVTWGPGDLAQAHTIDESVDLGAVETGLDTLLSAGRELLSGDWPGTD